MKPRTHRKTRNYTDASAQRAQRASLIDLGWSEIDGQWLSPYFGSHMSEADAVKLERSIETLQLRRVAPKPAM